MRRTSRPSKYMLVGGFNHFLFLPPLGEDSHFDEYVSDGLKPPKKYMVSLGWEWQYVSHISRGKNLQNEPPNRNPEINSRILIL